MVWSTHPPPWNRVRWLRAVDAMASSSANFSSASNAPTCFMYASALSSVTCRGIESETPGFTAASVLRVHEMGASATATVSRTTLRRRGRTDDRTTGPAVAFILDLDGRIAIL